MVYDCFACDWCGSTWLAQQIVTPTMTQAAPTTVNNGRRIVSPRYQLVTTENTKANALDAGPANDSPTDLDWDKVR